MLYGMNCIIFRGFGMYPQIDLPIENRKNCPIEPVDPVSIINSVSIEHFRLALDWRFIYVVRDNKIIDILIDNSYAKTGVNVVLAHKDYPQKYNYDEWYDLSDLKLFEIQQVLVLFDDDLLEKMTLVLKSNNRKKIYNIKYNVSYNIFCKIYELITSNNLENYDSGLICNRGLFPTITYLCICMVNAIEKIANFFNTSPYRILEKFYNNLERNFPKHFEEIKKLRKNLTLTKLVVGN